MADFSLLVSVPGIRIRAMQPARRIIRISDLTMTLSDGYLAADVATAGRTMILFLIALRDFRDLSAFLASNLFIERSDAAINSVR